MKVTLLIFCLGIFLSGCSSNEIRDVHPSGLIVKEIEPNKWTMITRQNLLHLAQVYDLSPFLFTKKIHIQSEVIPHSHPVLTISTRHAENPKKILSVFLHEELHWWLSKNPQTSSQALKELKKIYPKAPATGASKDSTYTHLLVCFLELKAMEYYLGKKEAREVITQIMKKDKIYPWVYYQILYKDFAVKKVIQKYKLLPPPLI